MNPLAFSHTNTVHTTTRATGEQSEHTFLLACERSEPTGTSRAGEQSELHTTVPPIALKEPALRLDAGEPLAPPGRLPLDPNQGED